MPSPLHSALPSHALPHVHLSQTPTPAERKQRSAAADEEERRWDEEAKTKNQLLPSSSSAHGEVVEGGRTV